MACSMCGSGSHLRAHCPNKIRKVRQAGSNTRKLANHFADGVDALDNPMGYFTVGSTRSALSIVLQTPFASNTSVSIGCKGSALPERHEMTAICAHITTVNCDAGNSLQCHASCRQHMLSQQSSVYDRELL